MKKKNIRRMLAAALVCGSILGINSGAYAAVQTTTAENHDFNTKDGWVLEGREGKDYFYKDGVLQKNTIITVWGIKFKCAEDGNIVGELVSDEQDVDKYMNQTSEDYKNHDKRWKKVNNKWHYCDLDKDNPNYSEANIVKNSWKKINMHWYHFNNNGDMDSNTVVNDDYGNKCTLNSDGALINPKMPEIKYEYSDNDTKDKTSKNRLQNKNGETYVIMQDGQKGTNWQMVDKKWYYCNKDGIVQKNKSVIIKGKKYVFGTDGVWIK